MNGDIQPATVAVTVVILGDDGTAARSAQAWLNRDDTLRGRVRLVEGPPEAETMGTLLNAVQVALAPGGAVGAFAGGLVYWLRSRSSRIRVMARRGDGAELEVSADRVRQADADQIAALVDQLASWLDGAATEKTAVRQSDGSAEE